MSTNEGMKDLIAVINRLHEVFTTTGQNLGLELPQIAVVGGQSAGKSSVLENFVGKDFLPRGAGIVTRRPLILQLNYSKDGEWAEFLHTGHQKFTDFNKVREEIEAETDRETGSNKGISKKPIHLRVYSPHVLDLTLIDLPGLTKVPVGDQPDDIEHQIREMIEDYINQENTLILAVSPANQDLANSDALKLARRADPNGMRTIGVITKLDLMDQGTDARDIFEGRLLPLKKGYIGVVNRSQKDIDDKKTIVNALEKEKEFFKDSPYRNMLDRMGTRYLQETLNDQLTKHIKEKLPGIKTTLQKNIQDGDGKLRELGFFDESERDVHKLLYRLMAKFTEDVHSTLEGNSLKVSGNAIKGGALIHISIYRDVYNLIKLAVKEPTEEQVSVWLANLAGYRSAMFTHQLALDIAVKNLVETYKDPITKGLNIIKTILTQSIHECCTSQFDGFPKLKEQVLYLMDTEIMRNEDKTLKFLFTYLEAQKAYVNDRHPEFRALRYKPEPVFSNLAGADGGESSTDPIIPENQVLVQGQAVLLTTGFRNDKDMFVLLYSTKIAIYKDEAHFQKNKDGQIIPLSNIQCDSSMTPKGQRYIIQRLDGRPLLKNEKTLELLVPKEKSDSWSEAFKDISIFNDVKGSTTSLRSESEKSKGWREFFGLKSKSKNVEADIRADPVNQEQTSIICQMVRKYMKIVDVSVYDMVPKYIILGLVQETERYAKEDLLGELLKNRSSDEAKSELMETGTDDKRKIAELVSSKEATMQALKILESI